MKFKSFIYLLALSLLFVLGSSSCIELTYETTINADGTGNQAITVDMSKIMTMMGEAMLESDTVTPELFKEKMSSEYVGDMGEFTQKVNSVEGLTNFETSFDGYSFTSTLNFNDQDMLGLLPLGKLNVINRDFDLSQKGKKSRLSWSVNDSGIEEMIFSDKTDAEKKNSKTQLMAVFALLGDGHITSIYHLPGKVKKVSDKDQIKVSSDKKTVTMKVSLKEMMEGDNHGDFFFEYK